MELFFLKNMKYKKNAARIKAILEEGVMQTFKDEHENGINISLSNSKECLELYLKVIFDDCNTKMLERNGDEYNKIDKVISCEINCIYNILRAIDYCKLCNTYCSINGFSQYEEYHMIDYAKSIWKYHTIPFRIIDDKLYYIENLDKYDGYDYYVLNTDLFILCNCEIVKEQFKKSTALNKQLCIWHCLGAIGIFSITMFIYNILW